MISADEVATCSQARSDVCLEVSLSYSSRFAMARLAAGTLFLFDIICASRLEHNYASTASYVGTVTPGPFLAPRSRDISSNGGHTFLDIVGTHKNALFSAVNQV